jgi:hypothetical protein
MSVDWTALEDRLYELSTAALRRFASDHADQSFAAFAFDCHAASADVLLCLHAIGGGSESVGNPGQSVALPPVVHWSHRGINCEDWARRDLWQETWWPWQDAFQEQLLVDEERSPVSFCEGLASARFLQAVAKVLSRMQTNRIFDCLIHGPDFRVMLHNRAPARGQADVAPPGEMPVGSASHSPSLDIRPCD